MANNPEDQQKLDELRRQQEEFEEHDLARARRLASSFANRAHVRTLNGLTRITFGEVVVAGSDPTAWTFAVTLTMQDAVSVAELILQQAQQEEERQAYYDDLVTQLDRAIDEPDEEDGAAPAEKKSGNV